MGNREKIILHKALATDWTLRPAEAERLVLALDLLDHGDLAAEVRMAADHCSWAADNLAQAETAAPQVAGVFGIVGAEETEAVLAAQAHHKRYRDIWWELKAQIDTIAADLERSIDPLAYALHDEAQVIA